MSKMALELIARAKAEGWKRLYLGNTGIVGEVPVEIWELTELEELILSDAWNEWVDGKYVHRESSNLGPENEISAFPAHMILPFGHENIPQPIAASAVDKTPHQLPGLARLQKLVLKGTHVADIQALANLSQIRYLNLSQTHVADIQPLANLSLIKYLDLTQTRVADIQPLANLAQIQYLTLSYTHVVDIQPLTKLSQIQFLSLSYTQVADIQPLAKLYLIKYLDLTQTRVANIQLLANLSQIQELVLAGTQVADIQPLANLNQIQDLYLSYTQVADIQPLANLSQIKYLDLNNTLVADIQPLANLSHIQKLYLSRTQVADIHTIKSQIEKGLYLSIQNCPLTNPPIEIARKGNQAILNFWREVEEENTIPATEIKLFLLGNTTAGKSTLAHILTKGEYPPKEFHSTFGAKIDEKWNFGNTTVHIWDFGGQEYFHATHQVLLNGNAIYIVVVDPEHNQDAFLETTVWHFGDQFPRTELLEHFHHRYWLEQIHAKDPHAHVLLLWNKVKDASHCGWLRINDEDAALFNDTRPLECFPCDLQLAFQEKDRFWTRKWEDIHDALGKAIQQKLEKAIVLSYWPTLQEVFAERAESRLWMPLDEFRQLCQAPGKQRDIDNIIVYLRDMTGRILYFDRPELAGKVFLNPQHINTLIYAVLSRQVIDNHGTFTKEHAQSQVQKAFQEIDALKGYRGDSNANIANDLLLIMQEFELIFETEKGSGRFVAPQYLTAEQPKTVKAAADFARLAPGFALRFAHYIPRHIVPRFIAAKGLLAVEDYYWKHGIIFREDGAHAMLWVDYAVRTITVQCGQSVTSPQDDRPLGAIFAVIKRLLPANAAFDISLDKNEWVSLHGIQTAMQTQAPMVISQAGTKLPMQGFMWMGKV